MPLSHSLDRLDVGFDDDHSVANAGLLLPATLAAHLGIENVANEVIDLGRRPGYFMPGAKVMTLVHAAIAGANCIDDANVLRAGASESVLGHRVLAPSTVGTFLRSFTFGHVRQLDKLSEIVLTRAWAAGAGPNAAPMTMDVDSTVCQVHGKQKQGAMYGYTHVLGYHPLLATRADTGETLHMRMRKGSANTARGANRFVTELVGRVRRAGASGQLTLRGDSGFWSGNVMNACRTHDVRFSLTVRQSQPVRTVIDAIDDDQWVDIEYPDGGRAQVAETTYGGNRFIVRRTRLVGPQAELFPNWRHHGLATDRVGTMLELEADHRRHAVVELAIRDLKEGSGLQHCPSGNFSANAAWLVLAGLAHNLVRWVLNLGLGRPSPAVVKTARMRLIAVPGRLTSSARKHKLALPTKWPWRQDFLTALAALRRIPLHS